MADYSRAVKEPFCSSPTGESSLEVTPKSSSTKEEMEIDTSVDQVGKHDEVISDYDSSGIAMESWQSITSPVELAELLERAKAYSHLVTDDGILVDISDVRRFEKRTVTVFAVDKERKKLYRTTKANIINTLTALGVKLEQVIRGIGYMMWDVLLPSEEYCMSLIRRELTTQCSIIRCEYQGRRRTSVTVFEVPDFVRVEHLAMYFLRFGNILFVSLHKFHGELRFDLLINRQAYNSIPTSLDVNGRKLLVVVAGRTPTGWTCNKIENHPTASPEMAPPEGPIPVNDAVKYKADPKTSKLNKLFTLWDYLAPSFAACLKRNRDDTLECDRTDDRVKNVAVAHRRKKSTGSKSPETKPVIKDIKASVSVAEGISEKIDQDKFEKTALEEKLDIQRKENPPAESTTFPSTLASPANEVEPSDFSESYIPAGRKWKKKN